MYERLNSFCDVIFHKTIMYAKFVLIIYSHRSIYACPCLNIFTGSRHKVFDDSDVILNFSMNQHCWLDTGFYHWSFSNIASDETVKGHFHYWKKKMLMHFHYVVYVHLFSVWGNCVYHLSCIYIIMQCLIYAWSEFLWFHICDKSNLP